MNDYEEDYAIEKANHSNDEEIYQPLAQSRESLTEHLRKQLQMLNLDEHLYMLGEEIIGNLDVDGYLKRNLEEIINELKMLRILMSL